MKKISYLFVSLLLLACTQNPSQQEGDKEEKRTVEPQKPTVTAISSSLDSLIKDFPKQWEELSHERNEYVFYQPCDSEIPKISIAKQADGSYQLNYVLGQESLQFTVTAMKKWQENIAEKVETYVELELVNGENKANAKVNVSSEAIGFWSGSLMNRGSMTMAFAPESYLKRYARLDAPCLECFGPEECEKEQNWGIGILKPIFEETIDLYNFKEDEKPAKKITFSNNMIANYDELQAWSRFENFFPDYDILYIRCLEETEDWYKILANKKNNRIMWVKKSPKVTFMTWEDYLKATLDATVLDPKANPFRTGKGTGKIITSECTGGYEVLAVDGMYAKVRQNELTTACDSGKPLTIAGWIQWRDSKKYLVSTSWVM